LFHFVSWNSGDHPVSHFLIIRTVIVGVFFFGRFWRNFLAMLRSYQLRRVLFIGHACSPLQIPGIAMIMSAASDLSVIHPIRVSCREV
jgi:hypothetical protein